MLPGPEHPTTQSYPTPFDSIRRAAGGLKDAVRRLDQSNLMDKQVVTRDVPLDKLQNSDLGIALSWCSAHIDTLSAITEFRGA